MREQAASYRITDLEKSERPRERLERLGPGSLATAELLAILLRTGVPGENAVQVGQRLLKEMHGLGGLHRATFDQVCEQYGVGPAKAAQIKAALELGSRLRSEEPDVRTVVHSPGDAADQLIYEMSALQSEELWVLVLDVRNRILKRDRLYRGSVNSSQVRVGEIFREAIRVNGVSVIVAHNHPSGDPTPSPEDIALTRAIVQAGKLVDVEVLDHLVIGSQRYVSLKERGLGF
jgi:DNA repair protein RadC